MRSNCSSPCIVSNPAAKSEVWQQPICAVFLEDRNARQFMPSMKKYQQPRNL